MNKTILMTGGLLLALIMGQSGWAGENLYRYRDHGGDIVIDDNVPPEFVAKGYDVLSRSGRVIEVVPPHVPKTAENQQADGESSEAHAQQQEDLMLLRSYSALPDLEKARDRRLQQLDREITIVESNLQKSRERLEVSRSKAANHQRSGRAVPQILLDNISELNEQIQDAEQMAQVRTEERRELGEKYQRYIDRFIVLKGLDRDLEAEKNQPSKLAIDPASALSAGD